VAAPAPHPRLGRSRPVASRPPTTTCRSIRRASRAPRGRGPRPAGRGPVMMTPH